MVWLILSVVFTIVGMGCILGYLIYVNSVIKEEIKERCYRESKGEVNYDFDKEFQYKYSKQKKSYSKCLWALPLLLLSVFGLFTTVETGHTGVITVFGSVQEQRVEFWNDKNKLLGKIVEIGYFEISSNKEGTYGLRFPTFKWVREDKQEISMY